MQAPHSDALKNGARNANGALADRATRSAVAIVLRFVCVARGSPKSCVVKVRRGRQGLERRRTLLHWSAGRHSRRVPPFKIDEMIAESAELRMRPRLHFG